jgi:hypothetical protein
MLPTSFAHTKPDNVFGEEWCHAPQAGAPADIETAADCWMHSCGSKQNASATGAGGSEYQFLALERLEHVLQECFNVRRRLIHGHLKRIWVATTIPKVKATLYGQRPFAAKARRVATPVGRDSGRDRFTENGPGE